MSDEIGKAETAGDSDTCATSYNGSNLQLPCYFTKPRFLDHDEDNFTCRAGIVGLGQKVSPGDGLLHCWEHMQLTVGCHPQTKFLDSQHKWLWRTLVDAIAHTDVQSTRFTVWNVKFIDYVFFLPSFF